MTSKDLAILRRAGLSRSLPGVGIVSSIAWITMSTLTFCWADMGTIGAFSATVPLTNFLISL